MPRKLIPTLIVIGLLSAAAPASAHGDVEIGDSFFAPGSLAVVKGKTVEWAHEGGLPHSVTAADGSWDSSPGCTSTATTSCMHGGDTFTHTFGSVGTFNYLCKVHAGMTGTISVVEPGQIPTTVGSLSATPGAGSVSVSGAAAFGGQGPQLIAPDDPGDGPLVGTVPPEETGVDLLGAYLYQPDPATPLLTFELRVTGLPDTGSLPEVIRYGFPFKTSATNYLVQMKLSNLASTSTPDDPSGHVTHTGAAFQLRGNCGQVQGAVNSCPHIGWITGEFDVDDGIVRAFLPIGSAMAPSVAPGAELLRNELSLAGNPVASYQAVVSNDSTQDSAAWEEGVTYTVPSKEVRLGIAPAGTPESAVSFSGTATVAADGSFTGSLSTASLAPGSYDVWAKGCFGGNCGTRRTTITI